MSFTLVLNSKNTYGTGNNCYKYDFIQGNFNIPPDSEVMVANVQIPYSFYNITQAYNNNQFQFSFPTGSSGYDISMITIPNGFYTTTSLNYFLQQWMISKGYYLVNGAGQNVYYYTIQYNSYQYGNQLLAYTVPTSLPSGYSYPSGYNASTIFNGNGFPTVSRTPFITILNNLVTFLGFTGGSYPTIGSGGAFSATLAGASIASFTINSAGSGYSGTLPIVLTGTPGTYSGYSANVVNGVITSINMGTSSGYSTAPSVSVTTMGGGSGANITCAITGGAISSFTIVSGGSGYISAKPVSITGDGTASGYNATVSATGTITAISGGTSSGFTNYPSPPVITITNPGSGTGFSATAVLNSTSIASLTLLNAGNNYYAPPLISFSGGGGSGASATSTINSTGNITGYTNLSGGSGYTTLPTISLTFVGANYSANSSITPVGSTVNSIIIRCSLVDNKVGIPMDILDSFTIGGTGFGNNINYSPNVAKWVKLSSGSFSNFYITFCDQNLSLIDALDNNILITLLFRLGQVKLLKNGEQ